MKRTLSMIGYLIVRDRAGNPILITERPVRLDTKELKPVGSVSPEQQAPQAPQATDEGGSDT